MSPGPKKNKWRRVKRIYRKGMHVQGVVRQKAAGAYLIEFAGGRHAYGLLREEEVEEARNEGYLKNVSDLAAGEFVTVAVEDYDDRQCRIFLTLRPLYEKAVRARFAGQRVGQEVTGTVTSLVTDGAFVNVDGGGIAFLPKNEIPLSESLAKKRMGELLFIGDRVKARILEKDDKTCRLKIGISAPAGKKHRGPSSPVPEASAPLDSGAAPSGKHAKQKKPRTKRRILVVEHDLLTMELIAQHLRNAGHEVVEALTLDSAREESKRQPLEFIVADVGMPEGRSTSFVLSLCRPDEQTPKAVFVTAQYLPDDKQAIIANRSRVREAILKPIDWDAFLDLFESSRSPETFEFLEYADEEENDSERTTSSHDELGALSESFRALCDRFPKCAVCVLKKREGAGDFQVVRSRALESAGMAGLGSKSAQAWRGSPIGDVLFDGKRFVEKDVSPADPGSFGPFVPRGSRWFRVCLGEPIAVFGEPAYAVFVFYAPEAVFDESHIRHFRTECERLSARIESARTLDMLALHQSRLSAGDFLLHELGGQIGNLDCVANVAEELRKGDLQAACGQIDKAVDACKALKETHLFFRAAAHKGAPTETKGIYLMAYRAFDIVKARADRIGIAMTANLDAELEKYDYPEGSVRPILFNFLMNALQQVLDAGREGGFVRIVGRVNPKSELPVEIRVSDSANGVHDAVMEEIFKPYVSHRPGGMGLGLHICDRLAKSLGGEVCVEESWMYRGSTFLLRLPTRAKEG